MSDFEQTWSRKDTEQNTDRRVAWRGWAKNGLENSALDE